MLWDITPHYKSSQVGKYDNTAVCVECTEKKLISHFKHETAGTYVTSVRSLAFDLPEYCVFASITDFLNYTDTR